MKTLSIEIYNQTFKKLPQYRERNRHQKAQTSPMQPRQRATSNRD